MSNEFDPVEPPSVAAPSAAKTHLRVLGRRVRALREQRRLTQERFASEASISVSFVSLLERGERSPSYETLLAIARILQVPASHFFEAESQTADFEPHFRLLRFAQQAQLTRAQVDRLIAVGQAMFDLGKESPSSTCRIAGCERKVLARSLCAAHYHRARRGDFSV
jgi:transcriptional regulator with XRE-family HTH domain